MDAQRRRFYLVIGLAITYGVLLLTALLFRREVLLSPPFVVVFLVLGFASALVMLLKAKRLGKYRKGFLLKATGMFLAIGGVVFNWIGVPNAISWAMTLSALVFFALGGHFVIKTAKEEARSAGSDRTADPPAAPGASSN